MFKLIEEKSFIKTLTGRIIPYLHQFHEHSEIEVSEGFPIRWDCYYCENAKGSILISHGFTESGYKFIEMVYYFHQMGFNVVTLDHRGHGKSFKGLSDNSLTDIDDFYDYISDMNGIVTEVLLKKCNAPYFLYSHSMGGAIAAAYLKKYKDIFSAAIFSSPMIRAQTAGIPLWMAGAIADAACKTGQGKSKVFVHDIYDPEEKFSSNPATSHERFKWYALVRKNFPYYQNNAATYCWLREAVKICTELTSDNGAEGINIPTIFYCANKDDLVDVNAIRAFASKIPHSKIVDIPKSRHEIYRSENNILEIYLNSIENFLCEQLESRQENIEDTEE